MPMEKSLLIDDTSPETMTQTLRVFLTPIFLATLVEATHVADSQCDLLSPYDMDQVKLFVQWCHAVGGALCPPLHTPPSPTN